MKKNINTIYKIHTEFIKGMSDEEKINYYTKNSSYFYEYLNIQNLDKKNILENYMKINLKYGSIVKSNNLITCNSCNNKILENEITSTNCCTSCGITVNTLLINEKTQNNTGEITKTQFTYDRRYHFKNLINQLQGKETTTIPNEVLDNIKIEIKKNRVDISKLQKIQLKEILKKLKYNKYYEHLMIILNKLNPSSIVTFSENIENKLYYMFEIIQEPFILYCPEHRSNMINYSYIFYKFCEILNLKEINYKQYFFLLKCNEKKKQLELIWKKIIEYIKNKNLNDNINWKFYSNLLD